MNGTENKAPAISVIVPVYHVEKYLRRCLDSILNQTFTDFEMIVVNDGGNEEESAICEEYAAKDPRVVYIHQENRGLSAARNAGLEIMRGEWVMFVDSDDWVDEHFCEKAYESVTEGGAEIGIFDFHYTTGDSRKGMAQPSELENGVYDSITVLKARIMDQVVVYVWNKIYHRSIWDEIRFPVGEIWEDNAVMDRVIDSAKKVAVIHDVLYFKPRRDDNITTEVFISGEYRELNYIMRRRRYYFLREKHPELLGIASNNIAITVFDWCVQCAKRGNKEGYLEARNWTRKENIKPVVKSAKFMAAYYAMLYCYPAFRIAVMIRQKRKERRAKIGTEDKK